MKKSFVIILSVVALLVLAFVASAEISWSRNVEIVVPAGAGGDTDFNARLFADKLSKMLPPNFVVSNVSGNGGAVGTRRVKDAKKDGSSVLFYHTALLVNKHCGTTNYGFEEYSFSCIGAENIGNVLTVRASLGIKTLKELYNYTKANPNKLKMAAQTGATSYAIAMQMKTAGFDLRVVDAGSAADRLAAIVGGHVDVILSAYGSVKDYIEEGELVALAMDGENDFVNEADKIDIKAIHNQGYETIKLPFYYFFAFPKGTDPELVQVFTDAVKNIVENDKEYQEKIYAGYYQRPFFKGTDDGLKIYDDIDELLDKVNLTGKL